MPELPEVETVVRGLRATMVGKRITKVEVRRRDLRYPIPESFEDCLQGAKVEHVERRAKYILMHLDNRQSMIGHLGMSGRMLITENAPVNKAKHDHVMWQLENGKRIWFNDARRFGFLLLCESSGLTQHPMLCQLGVEPLTDDFDASYLSYRIRGKQRPIKQWLMDATQVAGVGNIYASEALFRAKLLPDRAVGSITAEEVERLVQAVKSVLHAAIEAGGSSLKDYVQSSGSLGYFQHQFLVYGREGELCYTCGSVIKRSKQAGRSGFYCGECQV